MAAAQTPSRPGEVDYINAHGTSTPVNDSSETLALKGAWRGRRHDPGVVHQVHARPLHRRGRRRRGRPHRAGREEGRIPPTINLDDPDPECDGSTTSPTWRGTPTSGGRVQRFGFGGHNAPRARPHGGAVAAPVATPPGRLPGWRARLNRAATRIYGPRRGLAGFSWLAGERVAVGSVPVGDAVSRLPELGVTHVINCRAGLQTRISNDLWAERQVFGADHVMAAPMWDHGRDQPPALWAPAAEFGARVLEEDSAAGVLVHCQQGRRRSAMVAYAILRLRGHDPDDAERLVVGPPGPGGARAGLSGQRRAVAGGTRGRTRRRPLT